MAQVRPGHHVESRLVLCKGAVRILAAQFPTPATRLPRNEVTHGPESARPTHWLGDAPSAG